MDHTVTERRSKSSVVQVIHAFKYSKYTHMVQQKLRALHAHCSLE